MILIKTSLAGKASMENDLSIAPNLFNELKHLNNLDIMILTCHVVHSQKVEICYIFHISLSLLKVIKTGHCEARDTICLFLS